MLFFFIWSTYLRPGPKIYELGVCGDAGKHMIRPMQVWFRDLTTPMFFKRFANDKAYAWIYSYRVDWEKKVEER